MAGGGKSRGVSSKKKKKPTPLSKDPARLAAAVATLSKWTSDCSLPKMDLHTHSTCSDGRLSPTDLVTRAHRNGVNVMALTDHDTMEGVPAALKIARRLGIRLIPGVEISSKFATSSQQKRGEEDNVHILAYYSCCGPAHPDELEACLNKIREGRYIRAKGMVQKLKALNKPVQWEKVLSIAGEGVAPCRPHVARALVEAGHVDSVGEAFTRYLRDSGPAYVAGAEQPAEEVVRLIHRTGGLAVLAHPWSLKNAGLVIDRLKAAGLDGMEVYRSYGKDPAWVDCAGNLLKVGGSDYHATGALEETELGDIQLPSGAMLQFLTTAQPIWLSALRIILEEFSKSDLDSILSVSACWKGDITIRKTAREVVLILSNLLLEEDCTFVRSEALRLGLSHSVMNAATVKVWQGVKTVFYDGVALWTSSCDKCTCVRCCHPGYMGVYTVQGHHCCSVTQQGRGLPTLILYNYSLCFSSTSGSPILQASVHIHFPSTIRYKHGLTFHSKLESLAE